MIIGVSKLAYVRMASKTSDTPKRVIALRDLAYVASVIYLLF